MQRKDETEEEFPGCSADERRNERFCWIPGDKKNFFNVALFAHGPLVERGPLTTQRAEAMSRGLVMGFGWFCRIVKGGPFLMDSPPTSSQVLDLLLEDRKAELSEAQEKTVTNNANHVVLGQAGEGCGNLLARPPKAGGEGLSQGWAFSSSGLRSLTSGGN